MSYVMKVLYPDKIELQLIMSMTLRDWKELESQLKNEWPSSDLSRNICEMVRKADKHFYEGD